MEDMQSKLKGMFGDNVMDMGKNFLEENVKEMGVSAMTDAIISEKTLSDDSIKKIVALLGSVNKVANIKEIDEITNAVDNENDPDKARDIFKDMLEKAMNSEIFTKTIAPLIPQILEIISKNTAAK